MNKIARIGLWVWEQTGLSVEACIQSVFWRRSFACVFFLAFLYPFFFFLSGVP